MKDSPEDVCLNDFTKQEEARDLRAGTLVAGRYRLGELLGVGGMGMVYRAEDLELGLTIALKLLRSDLAGDELWIARLKKELLLARQVSHHNVVRIHDIGADGGLVFLSMDYVPGRSLADRLAAEKTLAPERAATIAHQIALGLEAAHQAGVVHRDIKPRNILLDEHGEPPRVAITDFGIASALLSTGRTLPGGSSGTPGYLSPEQARGEGLDGRSDLYAVGIVLYEMLTGEMPVWQEDSADWDLDSSIPRLDWPVEVPAGLRDLVGRLLAEDPAERPHSAAEVARALDPDQPAAAPAVRRWLAAGLATALLVPLLSLAHSAPSGGGAASASPAEAVETTHSVALLPLEDRTGRRDLAWIATGLPEILAASLDESPDLAVLDSSRVFQTVADLKLPRGPLPEADARRLAVLLDTDHVISGRVEVADGRLRVDLSLLATDTPGLPPSAFHAEIPEAEAPRLVEQIGALLRERLAMPALQAADLAPSHSPLALAEQARGAELLRRGDALGALPHLQRAVEADPRYTAAWVGLAETLKRLGQDAEARQTARRAINTLRPGDGRIAYQARALEARLLGRPERAQEILAQRLARYPDDVETRVELAEGYGEQGSLDRAVAALQEAVRRSPHHPRAWYLLGKFSILSGDARRAVDEYLVRALVVHNELGNQQGRADVLNAFGVGYRNLGEIDRAVESYQAAAALRRRIGDERGYAQSQRNLANLELLRGQYAAAQERLDEALAILRKLGDATGIADLYNELGVLAEQRGDYPEALRRYKDALRLRRDLGDSRALAESFGNVGLAHFILGNYDDALVYARQALDLARKSGDARSVVYATQSLGQLELARGGWDAAAHAFLEALEASRRMGLQETIPVSLGHLGRLSQLQGRPGAALATYQEALVRLRRLGDQRGLAEIHLFAGDAELEIGRLDSAQAHLQAAAQILAQSANREQQAELERLRGDLRLARGDRAGARQAWRLAVEHARGSHNAGALLAAQLAAAGGEDRLAELEALLAQAEALGDARLRLQATESVARAALAAGDSARARQAARVGLDLATSCGGYAGTYQLRLLLAAALESGGDPGEAAAERDRARGDIARLAQSLPPAEREAFDRLVERRIRSGL